MDYSSSMASVESLPAYLLPGVPVVQPPHLEGDPTLATEILPGPPSLSSVQQTGLPRKDHKKTVSAPSYLPTSDPGTTYGGHMVSPVSATMTAADLDGPRRKRARIEKKYVIQCILVVGRCADNASNVFLCGGFDVLFSLCPVGPMSVHSISPLP